MNDYLATLIGQIDPVNIAASEVLGSKVYFVHGPPIYLSTQE